MSKILIPAILLLLTITIYFLTSPGKTPYNYFTRLADSFIQSRLYTTEKPPWLNELIPVDGKFYVALPPMPAIMLIPFVFVWGNNFSETVFSIFLGGVNVVLVFVLLQKINFSKVTSVFVATFFAFGTNHWFIASVGSSWYLAHITAIFFLLLALFETFTKKRLLIIGLLIGASFWARTAVIFTLPFFYIYFLDSLWPFSSKPFKFDEAMLLSLGNKGSIFNYSNILNGIKLHLGILIFILVDVLYNYFRFSDFSPFSPYRLIQDVDTNTVVNGVYMSFNYFPRHIDALIFRLPKLSNSWPYLIPSLYATAIWFTSPLMVYIFKIVRSRLTLACWAAVLPSLFVVMQWAGVGFSQFGYRFLLDFIPFLLILVALGIGNKPSKFAYLLLVLSIAANAWGTIIINKFNIYIM